MAPQPTTATRPGQAVPGRPRLFPGRVPVANIDHGKHAFFYYMVGSEGLESKTDGRERLAPVSYATNVRAAAIRVIREILYNKGLGLPRFDPACLAIVLCLCVCAAQEPSAAAPEKPTGSAAPWIQKHSRRRKSPCRKPDTTQRRSASWPLNLNSLQGLTVAHIRSIAPQWSILTGLSHCCRKRPTSLSISTRSGIRSGPLQHRAVF